MYTTSQSRKGEDDGKGNYNDNVFYVINLDRQKMVRKRSAGMGDGEEMEKRKMS